MEPDTEQVDTLGLGDPDTWSDVTLSHLADRVQAERHRRMVIETAAAVVDQTAAEYQRAVGRRDGDAWFRPSSALNAYRKGAEVEHGGKRWRSLIPGNVWEPGDAGDPQAWRWWKDLTTVLPDGAWDPHGRGYRVGELVTHGGKQYRVRQEHTSQPGWAPPAVPALFEEVVPEPPGPGPGPAAWVPNGRAYAVDDRVLYNGATYRVVQAHTSQAGWTPSAVPALYAVVAA
jgi:hypothetical protein